MARDTTKTEILPVYVPIKGLAYNVPPTMMKPQYCAACKNVRFNTKEVSTRLGYAVYKAGVALNTAPLLLHMYHTAAGGEYLLLATEDGVYRYFGAWSKLAESLNVAVYKIAHFVTIEDSVVYVNGEDTPKKLSNALAWSNIANTRDYHPQFVGKLGERLILFNVTEDSVVEIEDCEDAWDESTDGDVTSTADATDYQWGAASAKLVVAAGVSDGDILATEALGAADLTDRTHIRLCIKSSVDVAAGDLHLLLDNHANCASPEATLDIGALSAGDWTEKKILITTPAALGAVISVGLKYTANSQACTIHIDAVRGVIATRNRTRIRYSIAGDMSDWSGTGSGAFSFNDGTGIQIMAVMPLGDAIAVYKDFSVGLLRYIGSKSIFRIDVIIDEPTLKYRRAITSMNGIHYFVGYDNIYAWDGGTKFIPIGDNIKDYLFPIDTVTYSGYYCFMLPSPCYNEILLFMRRQDGIGTDLFIYNVKTKAWSISFIPIITGGKTIIENSEERVLVGTSASKKVFKYDYSSANDDTTTIDSWFETPDFTINEEEYLINKKRFMGVHLEAKGNVADDTITMEYSTDGGVTWSAASEKTLTAVYAMYVWHFQTTSRRVRFRFANAKADEGFTFRFYGIEHIERERKG